MESKIQVSLTQISKNVACSYGYKLVCVDDRRRCCLQSRYCSDVMKKHFNRELVMTKEHNEDFKKSTKCWICDSD